MPKVKRWLQDGEGIRLRDHLLPYKNIKKSCVCGIIPTNTVRGPRHPERQINLLRIGTEKIKTKMETKDFTMGPPVPGRES